MRKYVSLKILRSIYFAIFDCYLSYCCLAWAQNCSNFQLIIILQKRLLELLIFNQVCLENILFISKSLNNLSPSVFNTWFSFSSDQHNYETSSSTQGNLIKLFYKTKRYGKYSITVSAVESWNKIQKQLKYLLLRDLSPNKIKIIVSELINNSLIKQKIISDFHKRNYCNY